MLKKRGQTWSLDLVIAVILFIVVVAVFYAFLTNKGSDTGAQEQHDAAKSISTQLVCDASSASSYCFVQDGVVDEDFISTISDTPYNTLKSDLGIQGDFCIYMVVVDDTGVERIVPFVDENGNPISGIGDSDFALSGDIACGDQI